jgi:hypothetical protein
MIGKMVTSDIGHIFSSWFLITTGLDCSFELLSGSRSRGNLTTKLCCSRLMEGLGARSMCCCFANA